jgi:hypothetical protein
MLRREREKAERVLSSRLDSEPYVDWILATRSFTTTMLLDTCNLQALHAIEMTTGRKGGPGYLRCPYG